jgi:hypothetical protein
MRSTATKINQPGCEEKVRKPYFVSMMEEIDAKGCGVWYESHTIAVTMVVAVVILVAAANAAELVVKKLT